MALDRDELAARATAARAALLSLCDALSALSPVAPASGAPATEPRRTVGAVVRWGSAEWIVVKEGEGDDVLRRLSYPEADTCSSCNGDAFVRWATREECERHGLTYVARPLPGAPLAAPSRPEWVRITSLNAGSKGYLTVGKVYRVTGWGHRDCPQVTNDKGHDYWALSSLGALPDPESMTFASWEPCAAPGETAGTAAAMPGVSPAATPAAWVPSVGDVVRTTEEPTTAKWDGTLVVLKDGFVMYGTMPHIDAVRTDKPGDCGGHYIASKCAYLRRATSSERAAAGLPVDESASESAEADRAFDALVRERDVLSLKHYELFRAGWLARARVAAKEPRSGDCRPASGQSATKPVDRVALAKVLYAARWPDENPAKLDADSQHLDGWLRTADAAIAFMAKGGAK